MCELYISIQSESLFSGSVVDDDDDEGHFSQLHDFSFIFVGTSLVHLHGIAIEDSSFEKSVSVTLLQRHSVLHQY